MSTNPERQPTEFDPSEELAYFHDPGHELYGLPERVYFYLIVTCHAIEAFSEPSFSIGPTRPGCVVEFVVDWAFWIDVSRKQVKLWTASGDVAEAGNQYLVRDGAADNPAAWEGLLKTIGRVEKFGVFINHADRLRLTWSEWLVAQQRLRDERGF